MGTLRTGLGRVRGDVDRGTGSRGWRSGGAHLDRTSPIRVMAAGAVLFAAGYVWLAVGSHNAAALAPAFVLVGLGIGCAETAQSAAVATLALSDLRGSAFGLLATAVGPWIATANSSPTP